MKSFYKYLILIALFPAVVLAEDIISGSDLLTSTMNSKKLELLPITKDYRNYFVLQSIEDQTSVIIGDFVGAERKIILINDKKADDKIDEVFEYYPDTKKQIKPTKPTTNLFFGMEETKKKIIDGSIFKEGYSYNMRSLSVLKEKLRKGTDVVKSGHGFRVLVYDPDNPSTIMSEYFFGREGNQYDLVFKTNYYRIFNTIIRPPLNISVFCQKSTDPYIKEIVEDLIKIVEKK